MVGPRWAVVAALLVQAILDHGGVGGIAATVAEPVFRESVNGDLSVTTQPVRVTNKSVLRRGVGVLASLLDVDGRSPPYRDDVPRVADSTAQNSARRVWNASQSDLVVDRIFSNVTRLPHNPYVDSDAVRQGRPRRALQHTQSTAQGQAATGIARALGIPGAIETIASGARGDMAMAASHGHKWKKGGGHKHKSKKHMKKGKKGEKGHKKKKYWDMDEHGKHGKKKKKSHFKKKGGHKKKYMDEKKKHGKKHKSKKGHKAEKYHKKKGHKKGKKMKGYHKKIHKDDYKKKHKFYEKKHKGGKHKKYGKHHKHHMSKKGKHKKGKHHKSAYHKDHKGKKGKSKKGHHDKEGKHWKGAHGHKEKHSHKEKYGKKGGKKKGKKWGFKHKH